MTTLDALERRLTRRIERLENLAAPGRAKCLTSTFRQSNPDCHSDCLIILGVLSEEFRLPVEDIVGPRKLECISRTRMAGMYIAREITRWPWADISKSFGNRHHTSVMYAHKATRSRIDTEPEFAAKMGRLLKKCQEALKLPAPTTPQ